MMLLFVIPVALACAGVVLYRYYRAGRLAAGGGWAAVILAVGGFGSGLSDSFAWSGLTFLFLGGLGLIIILQDAAIRRRTRRRRQTHHVDFNRNI